jgi:cytochrome c
MTGRICGLAAAALVLALAGCNDERTLPNGGFALSATPAEINGNPQRGAQLIGSYGCSSCHTIPGIEGANGVVGPPLYFFARRTYIAGMLPNNPDNLVAWIKDPQAIIPGNVMPDMGVTNADANDIAAYLYTIR